MIHKCSMVPVKSNPKTPFQKFTRTMDALMSVPHSELKQKLDEEKRGRKRKRTKRASVRASNGKG